MSDTNDYRSGRQAGWNRAETTLEGRQQHWGVTHPIPADASADYVQGYADGVELSNSGFNADGSRNPLAAQGEAP